MKFIVVRSNTQGNTYTVESGSAPTFEEAIEKSKKTLAGQNSLTVQIFQLVATVERELNVKVKREGE